ncbi:hypothetical protein V8G54_014803 [Vigna mungo]|uniref:Uncharacterized protein n=1 Tax=Vigna mungo TaxID=3915 RepID=A0AAQ3NK13_VIGMU
MSSSPPRSRGDGEKRPRFFDSNAKAICWSKADIVPGRHPERWRKDAAGNIVCKRFYNCIGCLCYEYDHIIPFSKGPPPPPPPSFQPSTLTAFMRPPETSLPFPPPPPPPPPSFFGQNVGSLVPFPSPRKSVASSMVGETSVSLTLPTTPFPFTSTDVKLDVSQVGISDPFTASSTATTSKV